MIGKILGAVVGEKLAQHTSRIGGPGGALLGAGAVSVARRLGPFGLVAAAIGGYALKRHLDKKQGRNPGSGDPHHNL